MIREPNRLVLGNRHFKRKLSGSPVQPWIASLIRAHEVAVTPDQMKTVPYVVELGPRLSALLQPEGQQRQAGSPVRDDGGVTTVGGKWR